MCDSVDLNSMHTTKLLQVVLQDLCLKKSQGTCKFATHDHTFVIDQANPSFLDSLWLTSAHPKCPRVRVVDRFQLCMK